MSKRKARVEDDSEDGVSWECTMCTFRNRYEAFKCEICLSRKGTSTRKPRRHETIVDMQRTVHDMVVKQVEKEKVNYRKREKQFVTQATETAPTPAPAPEPTPSINQKVIKPPPSPEAARQSPGAESSSDSVTRSSTSGVQRKSRGTIKIPDFLIFRGSPKKVTIVVNGVSATIKEFRRKPAAAKRTTPEDDDTK